MIPKRAPGFSAGAQVRQNERGMGDLVVDLQHQGCVEGIRRKFGIIGCAQQGHDVAEVLSLGALLNVGDGFRVDLFGDDASVGGDAASGADTEPTAPGADVGNGAAGFDVQQIHDAVDLEALVAARLFENAQVTGVRCAGWMRGRRGRLRPQERRGDESNSEEKGE